MELEEIVREILHEVREMKASVDRSLAAIAFREQTGEQMAHEVNTKLAARRMLAQIEVEKAQGKYDKKPRRRAQVAA